jgi:hypothetical protein
MANEERRDLSRQWAIRIERIRRYRLRSDTTGMTRPPRDPDESAFLRETGQQGPYVETAGEESASE